MMRIPKNMQNHVHIPRTRKQAGWREEWEQSDSLKIVDVLIIALFALYVASVIYWSL